MIASPRVAVKQPMTPQLESSEAAILSRVIQPDSGNWPHAAAEAILRMGFHEADQAQMTGCLKGRKQEISRTKS